MFRISAFNQQGFTLVEILVVMALVGLMASFVGPNLMNTLNRQQVNIEKLTVIETLRGAADLAFSKRKAVVVEFDGRELLFKVDSNVVNKLETEHVFFPPQVIALSPNGVFSQNKVNFSLGGKIDELVLLNSND